MMKAVLASLFIVSVPAVIGTTHTACYNYFLQKDGCVFSAPDARARCPAPKKQHSAPVQPFTLQTRSHKRSTPERLDRRYDDLNGSFPIGSGKGICGQYDSTKEIGVCLWSGAEQNNPTAQTAGWLNGLNTSNCGKRVYIQRAGRPDTVQYARVIDGCSFTTTALDVGCFRIGVTINLFNRFNPSPRERKDQLLYGGLSWDFDNLNGQSPAEGPF